MINNPTDWVLGGQRTRESNKSVSCTWPSDPLPNDHGSTWTPTDNQGTLVKTAWCAAAGRDAPRRAC